jgi:hypothetical protein
LGLIADINPRGYVALAVAADGGLTYTDEVETGLGGKREENMVAFAVAALKLLKTAVMDHDSYENSVL